MGPKIRQVTTIEPRRNRTDIVVRASGGDRLLSVRNDCEAPECCADLYIEYLGPNHPNGGEVHLNYDETRELIRLIRKARKKYRAEQDAREDAELHEQRSEAAW